MSDEQKIKKMKITIYILMIYVILSIIIQLYNKFT